MVLFPDSSSYNSGKAFVTFRQKYYHYPVVFQVGAIDQLVGFLRSFLRQGLAAVVQGFQISRKLCSLFLILRL